MIEYLVKERLRMTLTYRNKKILDEIISNPNVSSAALEKKYDLSRRQLGYSVTKINEWFMINNLPVIERTRQGQFIINPSVFSQLNLDKTVDLDNAVIPENERIQLILIMLIGYKEELALNDFSSELGVSKNTVLANMKQAQAYVDPYNLSIRYTRKSGYLLEGKEFQVRKLLIHIIYQLRQMNNGLSMVKKLANIQDNEIAEFHNRIENVENRLSLKFTDEKMETMPYILLLILRRIEKGNFINDFSIKYEEVSDTKEYLATEDILYDYEEIPLFERLFITLHLLTTNVYYSEIELDESISDIVPAIDHMLQIFEKRACIYFQEREQLLEKLLQHIKPAYYRIKYQLTVTTSFQDGLTKEFTELHHLLKQSTGPLEKLIGSDIPESETTFITMLVGGWMSKQGDSIGEKIKAIVVCPQGVSVSKLMFNELRKLFSEFVFLDSLSVREFLNYQLEYDIVFSTLSLETEKKLFISKAFLGDKEKQQLRKQVMMELYGYIPNDIDVPHLLEIIKRHAEIQNEKALAEDLQMYVNRDELVLGDHQEANKPLNLDELILPEHITVRSAVKSWDEAIRIASQPLVRSGKITQDYIEAMITNNDHDPYIVIGPNIAIPHAAPEDGASDVGMSLLRLTDGVQFTTDYTINLIVVIAAVDKQQHIHALMQLLKLAASEQDRTNIIRNSSIRDIYETIQLFSGE
ncbi:BglG family transcription antiterminator [Virgibacillus flavescens]|uniref:BglG family transcription antiterminator n=1 Tax=Virgibacillus flavescens TaxID=1611422 RepID=UPI003D32B5FA